VFFGFGNNFQNIYYENIFTYSGMYFRVQKVFLDSKISLEITISEYKKKKHSKTSILKNIFWI